MDWITIAISAVAGLSGALIGASGLTWRLATRFQYIEDRLNNHDERLNKGDSSRAAVPIIQSKLDTLIDYVKELKGDLGQMRKDVVTHGECDRRHATDSQ